MVENISSKFKKKRLPLRDDYNATTPIYIL